MVEMSQMSWMFSAFWHYGAWYVNKFVSKILLTKNFEKCEDVDDPPTYMTNHSINSSWKMTLHFCGVPSLSPSADLVEDRADCEEQSLYNAY